MESIWLVIIWALLMFVLSTGSFFLIYRKLGTSTKVKLFEIQKAESELLDELHQINILEIKSTEYGKQLFRLLEQETPHLLHKISSNQNREIREKSNLEMRIDEFVESEYAKISAEIKTKRINRKRLHQRKTRINNPVRLPRTNED